ncbi:MAG: hypothetical protein JNK10_03620 [Cyclobacteriaceae bacterium]|nr:hypothetical protein [Cyclobacteriaceae bacterium]
MKYLIPIVLCLIGASTMKAQVNNDNLANRIRLEPDASPLHSTTASSTVEWGCLNQALTDKCLIYHNDQWYSFQVSEPQAYYLNISRLVCRSSNGIQIILIEGNPCETKNYRVIQCIRQIKNEEVFIPLGMLTAKMTYLIEIDGFDGDHCDFDIQIARRPSGLPMKYEELLKSEAAISVGTQKDSLVDISWKVSAGYLEQVDQFRVYRLMEQDIFRLERALPSSKNAYGKPSDSYQLQDTLTVPGNYLYRVLGYPQNGQPVLMKEIRISYAKRKKAPPVSSSIVIDPPFSQKSDYAVRVYEGEQLSVIHSVNGTYDPTNPVRIEIDMKEFIAKGYRNYMVVLINKSTRESVELYYRVDARGSVVKD